MAPIGLGVAEKAINIAADHFVRYLAVFLSLDLFDALEREAVILHAGKTRRHRYVRRLLAPVHQVPEFDRRAARIMRRPAPEVEVEFDVGAIAHGAFPAVQAVEAVESPALFQFRFVLAERIAADDRL